MGKSILITGASSGIGRAAAVKLARPEHRLFLVGRRRTELEQVAVICRNLGSEAEVVSQDMAELDHLPAIVNSAYQSGNYPVLVNCAGMGVFAEFADLTWEDVQRQIQLNLMAPARLIHSALPRMLELSGGQIINVLSMTCVHILPGGGGYSTAKAGLQMLGKVVSQEYRKKGIKVTNLMPGAVDTPIWDGSPMASRMPEMIPTEEVANLIFQLVMSPQSFNIDEILMMPSQGVL
jgi:3-oxoacyl-[acyl-carrier protein] reductase